MRLIAHFIVSVILVICLYPFFGVYSLFAFLTGFLIDVDHYFYYIAKFRKFNVFEGNRYFEEVRLYNVLCVFHTIEVFFLVLVFSFFSLGGKMLFLGIVVHHVMDIYSDVKLDRTGSRSRSLVKYLMDLRK